MSAPTFTRKTRWFDFAEAMSADQLVGRTCIVLDQLGVQISPPRVHRLVHRYLEKVQHTGYGFAEWIAAGVALDAQKRREVADQLHRVIAYCDPTGEAAVRNVMRGAGS